MYEANQKAIQSPQVFAKLADNFSDTGMQMLFRQMSHFNKERPHFDLNLNIIAAEIRPMESAATRNAEFFLSGNSPQKYRARPARLPRRKQRARRKAQQFFAFDDVCGVLLY